MPSQEQIEAWSAAVLARLRSPEGLAELKAARERTEAALEALDKATRVPYELLHQPMDAKPPQVDPRAPVLGGACPLCGETWGACNNYPGEMYHLCKVPIRQPANRPVNPPDYAWEHPHLEHCAVNRHAHVLLGRDRAGLCTCGNKLRESPHQGDSQSDGGAEHG
jgi:hypothetical protein